MTTARIAPMIDKVYDYDYDYDYDFDEAAAAAVFASLVQGRHVGTIVIRVD
ncbi:hypothetical protein [Mycolicibacterium sp. 050158]|uniref:hypothetical protein n=1 Tax=Mycolicibacterium sp. 050158 TaxID=3090602 RepID=UPI00299F0B40|nr:hypothetical protein [Mycolicibacterium sp. 050158]MDX1892381.1 hypothetical protein [Mycolicibacterium sp. 050158]